MRMATTIHLRLSAAILLATAVAALCGAIGILPHLAGRLRALAASLAAMLLGDAVFFTAQATLLDAGPHAARAAYALTAALVILPMVGLIAVVATLAGLSHRVALAAWAYGLVQAAAGLIAGPAAYPPVRAVPDGYYLLAVHPTPMWVWDIASFSLSVLVVPLLIACRWRAHARTLAPILWVWIFCVPLYLNDTIAVAGWHTPYPLGWLALFAFAAVVWRLLERHVVETERRLSRDALTGAASREFLEGLLQERADRDPDGDCSLIFLDIDRFKDINDCHGHHVGDATLAKLAQTITETLPAGSVLARVGGDEFVAALPAGGDGAAVCAHLRTVLAATGLPTVSMGTATSTAAQWREAQAAADREMYAGKTTHHRAAAPQALTF